MPKLPSTPKLPFLLLACALTCAIKITLNEPPPDNNMPTVDGPTMEIHLTAQQFVDKQTANPYQFCAQIAVIANRMAEFGPECRIFDMIGMVISEFVKLVDGQHYFVVKKHGMFIWPAGEVGHVHELDRPRVNGGENIRIETMNVHPPIFQLHNFVSASEIEELVTKSKSVKLERSTGGLQLEGKEGANQGSVIDARTSTNNWDEHSALAIEIKKRGFSLLRIPFNDTWVDGLQMVHYDPGQYYMPHTDYFDLHSDTSNTWNFDPSSGGWNRIATIFIYLSDVDKGGHTVFPNVDQNEPKILTPEAEAELNGFKSTLFGDKQFVHSFCDVCAKSFSVAPKKGDAVLFYSINRNGVLDSRSTHGACPVLQGEKWGANLWFWSGPHFSLPRLKSLQRGESLDDGPVDVLFCNDMKDETYLLYWVSYSGNLQEQGSVAPGDKFKSGTYIGHKFVAKVDGLIVMEWRVHRDQIRYTVTDTDLADAGPDNIPVSASHDEL